MFTWELSLTELKSSGDLIQAKIENKFLTCQNVFTSSPSSLPSIYCKVTMDVVYFLTLFSLLEKMIN